METLLESVWARTVPAFREVVDGESDAIAISDATDDGCAAVDACLVGRDVGEERGEITTLAVGLGGRGRRGRLGGLPGGGGWRCGG